MLIVVNLLIVVFLLLMIYIGLNNKSSSLQQKWLRVLKPLHAVSMKAPVFGVGRKQEGQ